MEGESGQRATQCTGAKGPGQGGGVGTAKAVVTFMVETQVPVAKHWVGRYVLCPPQATVTLRK